jgi:hypothetical protein
MFFTQVNDWRIRLFIKNILERHIYFISTIFFNCTLSPLCNRAKYIPLESCDASNAAE